jgi:hypothetical protein
MRHPIMNFEIEEFIAVSFIYADRWIDVSEFLYLLRAYEFFGGCSFLLTEKLSEKS